MRRSHEELNRSESRENIIESVQKSVRETIGDHEQKSSFFALFLL